ncbi:succinate:cytochrome c oxidoreductase subunit 2 [Chlorella sorokiniana]|uniref:Succinate:cytochrome c oxidoreductase subunit 2 n=1 Tax=Chlorella sorokiniana TaxID=3076 RepID=A0A2P6TLP8_CHLSO|nr:succinate:cytochrome c oxidoreductase subunit 2 [Chlorella sorokiniana]|eukprot:PRW45214.1 succinate:cytochrome c oxidoreductase subunit 2 [Chlorella sorokiniana]
MLLDVLLKIRDEQDPSLVIKFGCRRGRCGACAAVVNGVSLLPCCTPINKDITGVSTVKGLLPPIVPVAPKDCY